MKNKNPLISNNDLVKALADKFSLKEQYRTGPHLPIVSLMPKIKTVEFKDIYNNKCFLRQHEFRDRVSINIDGRDESWITLDKEAVGKLLPHLQKFFDTGDM